MGGRGKSGKMVITNVRENKSDEKNTEDKNMNNESNGNNDTLQRRKGGPSKKRDIEYETNRKL